MTHAPSDRILAVTSIVLAALVVVLLIGSSMLYFDVSKQRDAAVRAEHGLQTHLTTEKRALASCSSAYSAQHGISNRLRQGAIDSLDAVSTYVTTFDVDALGNETNRLSGVFDQLNRDEAAINASACN